MTPALTRRRFLAAGGAVGAAALVGGAVLVEETGSGSHPSGVSAGDGIAVLVTLSGGNDGLNTLIPYGDPAYLKARPTLGYQPHEVLALDRDFGLNPKLTSLKRLWDQRQLAVVRGVGYPDGSLSHFESTSIWQTADLAGDGSTGWLGRWLDATSRDPLEAVSVGDTLSPAMRGSRTTAAALSAATVTLPGPTSLQVGLGALVAPGATRPPLEAEVASSGSDLLAVRSRLDALPHLPPAGGSGGATKASLGDQLNVVASLIRAGSPTRAYQVSLSSFDTHANEKAAHERVLAELDAGVGGFFQALRGSEQARRVVLFTASEFGRRPAQNASGGTDHGTASVLFVAGPSVAGGRYVGEQPSLSRLDDNGNLLFSTDFRSVYATVLGDVLGADPASLLGGRFPTLSL